MKARLFFMFMILSALICSCGEDDVMSVKPEKDTEVRTRITLLDAITDEYYYFAREGGVVTVTFKADGPWDATPSEDWILVQPTSGEAGTHQLTITIPTCDAEDTRHA